MLIKVTLMGLSLFAALCAAVVRAQDIGEPRGKVPAAVGVPYSVDRTLATTDAVLLDWKDAVRNRAVPVKVYYPITGSTGPFPVIIFSHGLGGTRNNYEYLGRQWAAHGYVVIHTQHVGSDDSAWRGQARPMESMVAAASLQNAIDRDRDIRFVIDQLETLNKSDAKLKGLLDTAHIGMSGHSFGAVTTAQVIGEKIAGGGPLVMRMTGNLVDNHIKAAIAMSASVPSIRGNLDAAFDAIKVPIFYMTGTDDDSPIGDTKAADRRLVFDHTKSSDAAYLLILKDADHMTFSGRLQSRPLDEPHQKLIRIASTAFWDAYLKDDATAKKWLDDDYQQFLANAGTFERK